MIENFCIVVNTVSTCSDIWPMFFGQLEEFFPNQKVYIFSDVDNEIFKNYEVILYDKNLDFRTQYLNCLVGVKEEYMLNLNDDYILYNIVNVGEIERIISTLSSNEDLSFIRLAKGYNYTNLMYDKNLFLLDLNQDFFYSQTASIWKTKTLLQIHQLSPISSIGRKDNLPQLEVVANNICKKLELMGLFYHNNEPKRGSAHYDTSIFPYIASALVAGKWNLSEYKQELLPLIFKYEINTNKRGVF
jgi:hypothetical protein